MKSRRLFQYAYTTRWVAHTGIWGSLQQRSACFVLERECFLRRDVLRTAVNGNTHKSVDCKECIGVTCLCVLFQSITDQGRSCVKGVRRTQVFGVWWVTQTALCSCCSDFRTCCACVCWRSCRAGGPTHGSYLEYAD